ncbi:MAG: peptide ABC transporter substrate-binding protein [Candidatus Velthaea sp.]|jgi:peptide/nickel transport system substrate-binding protein
MKRRRLGALVCALLFAACSKVDPSSAPPAGGEHAWTHPGELRIAIQSEPMTLNPVLSSNTTEGLLNRLSFDTLVSVEADGKTLVPILAKTVPSVANGGISSDGLTITYRLRSGVKWQDGVPFTSKDVKFTWQAMLNNNNNVTARVGYEDVRRVDTPDATTVVFHLKQKFAPFVNTVFAESDDPICIVPEHILGKYKDVNRVPFNQMPIGTGPFKVVRWVRGDHIELAANPEYFLGPPKLKTIVVREVPDENTSINQLRTHDIDWLFEPSPNLYNVLKTVPETTIRLVEQPGTLRLLMNLTRPVLEDIRVRRAIAYAVDKESLVDRLTGGSARVAGADQPPFSWAYRANVTTYGPNVAKARALLTQAGFTPGPNGIFQKNGQPLTLELSTNTANVTRRLVQTQVQAMLHAAGIDAPIKNYPGNLFFATYGQGGVLSTGKYDLAIYGWIAGIDPDDHALYGCNQFPPHGTNYSRYCSAAMDSAQRAALASYEQPPRKSAYFTIQELIAADVPEVIVWYARTPQATNPDFKGFAPNPVNEAWNAYQWEI